MLVSPELHKKDHRSEAKFSITTGFTEVAVGCFYARIPENRYMIFVSADV